MNKEIKIENYSIQRWFYVKLYPIWPAVMRSKNKRNEKITFLTNIPSSDLLLTEKERIFGCRNPSFLIFFCSLHLSG